MGRWKDRAAIYLTAELLICFCLCQYGIRRLYGFALYPDEFGYWTPAARLLGWDWTGVSGTASYYSFGYGVFLAPILYFVKDPTAAYRMAVFGNMLLMCAGLCLLRGLLTRLFPKLGKAEAALCAGIGTLYPAWSFYAQTTMTEALLLFLYLLVLWLFFRFMERGDGISGALLAAALAYLFSVHMRGIGTAAAACAVLSVRFFAEKGKSRFKQCVPLLAILAALLCAGLWAGHAVTERLYRDASPDVLEANAFWGQWKRLFSLLNPKGVLRFLAGLAGKLLYMGLATFGLAWRGLAYTGKRSMNLLSGLRRKKAGKPADYFCSFLFLSALSQVLVAVVYTAQDLEPGGKLDPFVHGRYCELVLPMLLAIGLRRMLAQSRDGRKLWGCTAGIVAGLGILTGIAAAVAERLGLERVRGYFMTGMSYLSAGENCSPAPFLWKAWAFGSAAAFGVTLAVFLYRKLRRAEWMLTVLLGLQVLLGLWLCERYLYRSSAYSHLDMKVAERAEEVLEERRASGQPAGEIIHFYEGGIQYIAQVQFCLREQPVRVWSAGEVGIRPENLTQEDLVITGSESEWNGMLETVYREHYRSGHLILYYNPPGT